MGQFGKRARVADDGRNQKNSKRRGNGTDENSHNELVVYRILCPDTVIGSVIGKSGKVINAIRKETGAWVKVVDPFPGAKERVITMYCHVKQREEISIGDEINDREPVCSAQDALLKLHAAIINAVASTGETDNKKKDVEECKMLVPASQSSNIIGKAGATIKKIRSSTKANIKVTPKEADDPSQSCARDFDNFIAITGDSKAVRQALYTLSAIMYKFPPKEEIPLDTSVPEIAATLIIPSDAPMYPTSGFYPSGDSMITPRSIPQLMGNATMPDFSGFGNSASAWPSYSSSLHIASGYGPTSQAKELVIKVLCPFQHIGRVIGRSGISIKSIRQESGARIEVDDKKANREECMITVIATESSGDLKSMAVEAVLLLQQKINGEDSDSISFRLLVPSKVIGCIIGKGGFIITEIRKRTGADIRISKGNKPKCAAANDELVEVVGDVGDVRDAIVQIVLRLRDDVLGDRDGDQKPPVPDFLYTEKTVLPMPAIPQLASSSYDQRSEISSSHGPYSSSNLYGYEPFLMGEKSYGSMSSYKSKLFEGFSAPSTLEMLIPADAIGKVMGKGGANIATIRKISGADVEISESTSSRRDHVALISGTPEQRRSAENLIQAFILAV
ncbi:unnamed protein product [Rhodiola kirilowii]